MAQIAFDNGNGNLLFGDDLNWVGAMEPGVGDDAEIDGFAVTLDTTTTINALSIANGSSLNF